MLQILEALERPWFVSGSSALFALRTGGFGFKFAENFVTRNSEKLSDTHKQWMSLLDADMDFTVLFHDKEDQAAKYRQVSALCNSTSKLRCSRSFPDGGSSVVWEKGEPGKMNFGMWGAFRNGTDRVTINGIAKYDYDMPWSRLFPTKYAKFHTSWIRVPNDFMWAFSHFRPYSVPAPPNASVDTRQVEYGMGCIEMAYPKFLLQSAGVPASRPINAFPDSDPYEEIRRIESSMVRCARCLESVGCASFTSCFT